MMHFKTRLLGALASAEAVPKVFSGDLVYGLLNAIGVLGVYEGLAKS